MAATQIRAAIFCKILLHVVRLHLLVLHSFFSVFASGSDQFPISVSSEKLKKYR
jgi:hypothetical protein